MEVGGSGAGTTIEGEIPYFFSIYRPPLQLAPPLSMLLTKMIGEMMKKQIIFESGKIMLVSVFFI